MTTGREYRPELGQYVEAFLSKLCHTKGKWAGQPFKVLDWQSKAIREFYGTVEPNEDGQMVRSYQYLYEEIPKKNGKTELAAGLGLYHLMADGEAAAEVYICAADKDNASICFNAILYMINNIPGLRNLKDRGVLKVGESQKFIKYRPTNSLLRVLSSDFHSKHGYSPSCVIFDELHAQPNRNLWDVMTGSAGSARQQPVWIVLTTAGDDPDRQSIGWEIHEKCRRFQRLRAGNPEAPTDEDDPLWLPIMYGISTLTGDDPDKIAELDIYDETLWELCNPSLGETVSRRQLRQEARSAKQSEAEERKFRWLRLNQWISTKTVGWLPLTLYDRTQWHIMPVAEEKQYNGKILREMMRQSLRGKTCFVGLDLSYKIDLTAVSMYFPIQDGLEHSVTLFHAWRPLDDIADAEKRDHVPYQDWERAGFMTLCKGETVNLSQVRDYILEAAKLYSVKLVGIDPWKAQIVAGAVMDVGIPVVEIPQGFKLSPTMSAMEKALRDGEMKHEHNTAARWCFGNVRVMTDDNDNVRPTKKRSIGRIDITVSWIIAVAASALEVPSTLEDDIEAGTWTM